VSGREPSSKTLKSAAGCSAPVLCGRLNEDPTIAITDIALPSDKRAGRVADAAFFPIVRADSDSPNAPLALAASMGLVNQDGCRRGHVTGRANSNWARQLHERHKSLIQHFPSALIISTSSPSLVPIGLPINSANYPALSH
jgi:hypothetical protein